MLSLGRLQNIGRRFASQSSTSCSKAIATFLKHECLNPIRDELKSNKSLETPFDLSTSINNILKDSSLPAQDASAIHNRLIEEFCEHEYGLSQIHAKKLRDLGQPLSAKSILEIIKNNPGRVFTSWELLLKHGDSLAKFSDDLLSSALENIVLSIQTKDVEFQDLSSIVQSVVLLSNIQDKKYINPKIVEKLAADILDTDVTCLLPLVLDKCYFPIRAFEQRIDVLSDYQTYLMAKNCPFNLLCQNEKLLLLAVDVLGKEEKVHPNEKEGKIAKEVENYSIKVKDGSPLKWEIKEVSMEPIDSAAEFIRLFEHIHAEKLDESNLELARKLLRSFGVFRGNTRISLELYHSYLLRYPKDSQELMFETFLALAYQSYKTGNKDLLDYAEVFIPDDTCQSMLANIYRVLILVKGKFDIEQSLQLYNERIESLSKVNDSKTNVAPAGLVTEALILAFLSKNELDFARVIFDGSVREKLVTGPTAIKRIKRLMALYGETVEEGKAKDCMNDEVLKMLGNI